MVSTSHKRYTQTYVKVYRIHLEGLNKTLMIKDVITLRQGCTDIVSTG